MRLLQHRKSEPALLMLQKALSSLNISQELISDATIGDNMQFLIKHLLGLTHNNLGCVFKQ